ncbi:MAG: FAD/NAD(P)-binding protein [Halothiobacillaceae bacterium]
MMTGTTVPMEAEIVERTQEARDIFTLRLRLTDPEQHARYQFAPGQFNMVYLHGVGEVAISIVSDVEDAHMLDHTIRAVGRVTNAIARLEVGDRLGIRGPFGVGWPLEQAEGRNVVVLTGGLGCAPAVSAIRHVLRRRDRYRHLSILQGVKHGNDLIWRDQYDQWRAEPDTEVWLAADEGGPHWAWDVGLVTSLFDKAQLYPEDSVVMMCGPEPMMRASAEDLVGRGFAPENLYLSMERNMKCGVAHCGHCQYGPEFICKDGPVFPYPRIRHLLGERGF